MSFIETDRAALLNSFGNERDNILNYWATYAIDDEKGGFYGELTNENKVVAGAAKGSVLNARILWSFSAGYNQTRNAKYLEMANRAFNYICAHFVDAEFGGIYWAVTAEGIPVDTKKQIYALAFIIYGCAEYYKAGKNKGALLLAKTLFFEIEKYSFDPLNGGYLEAFTRDWQIIDDQRLSDKDANERKTMNTHLHVLEAYTTLYEVWSNEHLEMQIRKLINNFTAQIIDLKSYHLILFLDEDWREKSDTISYGHDIEASWLILEAAEVLRDPELTQEIKQVSVKIAAASAKGINADGSMNYEYEPVEKRLVAERHWWVQAEALVGFFNAWQISNDPQFLNNALRAWAFIQRYIIDRERGEWFWGMDADGTLMQGYGKVGLWKCPYHNSRACIEMVKRLTAIKR